MVSKTLYSSASGEWETPQDLFDRIDAEFHFTLDVCATAENAKCGSFLSKEQDGLTADWENGVVWCNPPYGRGVEKWVKRCAEHSNLAVMLLPARTDTRWFHEHIWDSWHPKRGVHVWLLKGRLKFGGAKNSAPFPSMVVVFNA